MKFSAIYWLHRSARLCCWAAEGHFRSDFLRRIRIRDPEILKP